MLYRYLFSFAILFIFILNIGCNSTSPSDSADVLLRQPSQKTDGQNRPPDINKSFNLEDSPIWRKEVLQRLLQDSRFRVPEAKSFRIPEAAQKDSYARIDIETATARPFIIGDINHDGLSQDIVLIVEDSTNTANERFSVIIFNEPADRKTTPVPIWLYKDRDLSKTTLNWWSGGLSIRTYNDDGTYNLCYVNWDAKTKSYFCSEKWKK